MYRLEQLQFPLLNKADTQYKDYFLSNTELLLFYFLILDFLPPTFTYHHKPRQWCSDASSSVPVHGVVPSYHIIQVYNGLVLGELFCLVFF